MKTIVKMLFGSKVYGTNLPSSDTDYKEVFLPDPRDIFLFKTKRIMSSATSSGKNSSEDIDVESIEFGRFLELCMAGQTNALDMLFTPKEFWLESSPVWERVLELRPHILNKKVHAMVGYCKSQASKYSLKGDRMNDAKAVLGLFRSMPSDARLSEHLDDLAHLAERKHVELTDVILNKKSGKKAPALMVCGRYMPVTTTFGYCIDSTLTPLCERYGRRSQAAAEASGADYKAMMHALRISGEAIELLETGSITLPLKEADYLLRVRKGEVSVEEISEEIESRLKSVTAAVATSSLPEESDRKVIEQIIYDTYRYHFLQELN
jgi:predicted nucleotidyltransferase